MKYNLLAVSHDAGGAEVLSSYLKHTAEKYRALRCVAQGPAKKIYLRKGLRSRIINAREGIKLLSGGKIDMLVTSTSRSSDLEKKFIRAAKNRFVKTAAMLEHWVYFRERFDYPSRDWKKNLPDEIWVVDKLAKNIAERDFGGAVSVRFKPNLYFKDLRSDYRNAQTRKDFQRFNILFLNEPVLGKGVLKKKKIGNSEVKKVARLIDHIRSMPRRKGVRFMIRQHPIESPSRYSAIVGDNADSRNIRVALSDPKRNSLVRDIKNADVVIGIKSSALMIASLFKNTISWCDEPPLWFSGYKIKHVRPNLNALGKILKEPL